MFVLMDSTLKLLRETVIKACSRIGNEFSEWFSVNVGVRQGCVISPWLFNLYMDGVMRELQARTLGRGAKLVCRYEEK